VLAVAGIAVAVVAIGVLRVGRESFAALMMAAGDSAEHARAMFDASVTVVVLIALLTAAVVALLLAIVFARMLARPIRHVASAAERIAAGDLTARVPEDGPTEVRALAAAYNAMADRLEEQELVRREFVVNASHEIRTPLTNLQGYLEALGDDLDGGAVRCHRGVIHGSDAPRHERHRRPRALPRHQPLSKPRPDRDRVNPRPNV